jgi:ribose transport system permease protein
MSVGRSSPAEELAQQPGEGPRARSADGWRGRARGLAKYGEPLALPAVWVVGIIIFGSLLPDVFLTTSNFSAMFSSQTSLLVVTLALIVPLTAGEYDLSVGSVAGLSSMMIAFLNVIHHWPILPSVIVALLACLLVGAVNAVASVGLGVDTLIVTLGMGTLLEGIVAWLGGSNVVTGISQGLVKVVVLDKFLGLPLEFWYGIVACVVVWYFLRFTPVGRRLLIVGRGRDVARLSGMRVKLIRSGALVCAAGLAGVAGVLVAGTSGAADPSVGPLLLLPAFAAAFLGATTISPGRFNAWGSLIAVLFLVTGFTGLVQLGAPTYIQDVFYGAALIIAVAFSVVLRQRRR